MFRKVITISIFTYCFIVSSVSAQNFDDTQSLKHTIMVSVPPQKYFVEQIVQDKFNVAPLILEEPHGSHYYPATSQYVIAEDAVAYIKIGIWEETNWLEFIKIKNKNIHIFNEAENISLYEDDINIWLDPILVKQQLKNIYNFVAQLDPKNKDFYHKNYFKAVNKVAALDYRIKAYLKHRKTDTFVTFNASYHYFAKRYELKDINIKVNLLTFDKQTIIDVMNQIQRLPTKLAVKPQKYFPSELEKDLKNTLNYQFLTLSYIDYNWEQNLLNLAKAISKADQ